MSEALPVIINAAGGTAARMGDTLRAKVEAAFEKAGVAIALTLCDGDVTDAVRGAVHGAAGAPLVVVGGGDGTLGAAAGIIAGSEIALGILPLGTRNHLARELGLPLDLDGAARVIAERPLRAIDVGRVGERVFVNNASIGFYPAMVQDRDALAAPKWLAAVPAAVEALRRIRHHRLRLQLGKAERTVTTPLLFVGNNHYELTGEERGQRRALDDGQLSVYAVASRRRLALVGLALRTLLGRVDPGRDFAALGDTAAMEVCGESDAVDIALDGEVVRLAMPLSFRSDPGTLKVVAPAA